MLTDKSHFFRVKQNFSIVSNFLESLTINYSKSCINLTLYQSISKLYLCITNQVIFFVMKESEEKAIRLLYGFTVDRFEHSGFKLIRIIRTVMALCGSRHPTTEICILNEAMACRPSFYTQELCALCKLYNLF